MRTNGHTLREVVETVFDGWFADEARIDWEDFYDRVEAHGIDIGDLMDSPITRQIKAIVRELRAEQT